MIGQRVPRTNGANVRPQYAAGRIDEGRSGAACAHIDADIEAL